MDESAIKGLKLLKVNDSDADIRKPCSVSLISVEGYDTWRQAYLLKLEVERHFASCGRILSSHFPIDVDDERCILKSVGFIRIEGEGAADKALELNGTDVCGWTAIVKLPGPNVSLENRPFKRRIQMISVEGYDTSLPEIDIQVALCNHFSSCGPVWRIFVYHKCPSAEMYLEGEECLRKALELNGSNMGERTLQVYPIVQGPLSSKKQRNRTCTSIGYTPQFRCSHFILPKLAEKKKKMMMKKQEEEMKKREKEMKMKMKTLS